MTCYSRMIDNYPGDFPCKNNIDQLLHQSCVYELHSFYIEDDEAFRNECKTLANVPLWIKEKPQIAYEMLVSLEDYEGAWYALNAEGWQLKDAKVAIQELRGRSTEDFDQLIDAWCELPFQGDDY